MSAFRSGWIETSLAGAVLRNTALVFLAAIIFSIFYYFSGREYRIFHVMVEAFGIVFSAGVFSLVWNARRFVDTGFYFTIAIGYICSAIFSAAHILTYQSAVLIPVTAAGDASASFWLSARYMQSFSLLAALFLYGAGVRIRHIALFFALVTTAVFLWIFRSGYFLYAAGSGGPAVSGMISSIIIMSMLAASAYFLYAKRSNFIMYVLLLLMSSVGFLMLSELFYMFHFDAFSMLSAAGHFFKIASVYMIYRAVMTAGFIRPYDMLFRNLKANEVNLRKERDLAKKYLDISADIIVELDRDGRVLAVNRRGCDILGCSEQEILGQNWFDNFIPGNIKDELRFLMAKLITGETFPSEYNENPVISKNGSERIISWHNSLLRDEHGEVTAVLSAGNDVTEKNRVEEALKRSEERYRLLFNSMTEGFAAHEIILDDKGKPVDYRFLDVNPAFERQTGLKKEDVIDKTYKQVLPQDTPRFIETYGAVALSGNPERFQEYSKMLEKYYEIYAYCPVRGQFATIFTDITDREAEKKELEEAQRRVNEELEKRVQKRTSELMAANEELSLQIKERAKAEKKIILRNEMLNLMYSTLSKQEFLNAIVDKIAAYLEVPAAGIRLINKEGMMPYAAQRGFEDSFVKAVEKCGMNDNECVSAAVAGFKRISPGKPVLTGNGSFLWEVPGRTAETTPEQKQSHRECSCFKSGFESFAILPVRHGRTTIGVFHVAGGRKTLTEETVDTLESVCDAAGEWINKFYMEDMMRTTNQLLEQVFNSGNYMIVYLDAGLNFIRVNQAYAEASGKSPDFFEGRNYFDVFPQDINKELFLKVAKNGDKFAAYEQPFVYTVFSKREASICDWVVSPVIDNSGRVEGLVLVIIDKTEQKLNRDQLNEKEKELMKTKRLSDIGTLAATVAHELRNPLGVIRTAVYNIKRKTHGRDLSIESHIANIDKKIKESDQIINNLLGYSRIKQPQYEKVNIYNLLEECVNFESEKYSDKRIVFDKDIEPVKDVFVDADPVQIREVFNNVLDNACQAVEDSRGRISISAVVNGNNSIELVFRDNGHGVPPGDLGRVFEPFFTNSSKGTGLGLTVSKELISLHKGSIALESKPGEGAAAIIRLPMERGYRE